MSQTSLARKVPKIPSTTLKNIIDSKSIEHVPYIDINQPASSPHSTHLLHHRSGDFEAIRSIDALEDRKSVTRTDVVDDIKQHKHAAVLKSVNKGGSMNILGSQSDLGRPQSRLDAAVLVSQTLPKFPSKNVLMTKQQQDVARHSVTSQRMASIDDEAKASQLLETKRSAMLKKKSKENLLSMASMDKMSSRKSKELEKIKETVEKQNIMLSAFQREQEELKDKLQETPMGSTLSLYDDRISQLEMRLEKAKKKKAAKLAATHPPCTECENEQAKNTELTAKIQELTEKLSQHPSAEKMVLVQHQNESLQAQLASLQALNSTQGATMRTLLETLSAMEMKLNECTLRMESVLKSNKKLLQMEIELRERLDRSERRQAEITRDYEKERKWRRQWEDIIEEWKRCIEDVENKEDEPFSFETPSSYKGVLEGHLKRIQRETHDYKRKLTQQEKHSSKLEKDHATLLQRYMLEMDRKQVELSVARDRLRDVTETAEKIRRERDLAVSQSQDTQRENVLLTDKTKQLLSRKEDEISEILEKSNSKIKSLREQYDNERDQMRRQIEDLHLQKTNLQVELSQALRSKTEHSTSITAF